MTILSKVNLTNDNDAQTLLYLLLLMLYKASQWKSIWLCTVTFLHFLFIENKSRSVQYSIQLYGLELSLSVTCNRMVVFCRYSRSGSLHTVFISQVQVLFHLAIYADTCYWYIIGDIIILKSIHIRQANSHTCECFICNLLPSWTIIVLRSIATQIVITHISIVFSRKKMSLPICSKV
jgi:hypothetical protein